MTFHRIGEGDSLSDLAALYYGDAEVADALATHNGIESAAALALGMELHLPVRLHVHRGVIDRSRQMSVVKVVPYPRQVVFVDVKENTFTGAGEDMVPIAGKWLYVFSDGAVVARVHAEAADAWDVENLLFNERTQTTDGKLKLRRGRNYSFFLSPRPLTEKAEQYLLKHLDACDQVMHLTPESDDTAFARDVFEWAVVLHENLYLPRLEAWREWTLEEKNAARLFIASTLKALIGTDDRFGLQNEIDDGQPEQFLDSYKEEELRLRRDAEDAMAQVAHFVESHEHRAIELSAMEVGDAALEESVVHWATVLDQVTETHPGRILSARLVSDEERLPSKHLFTDNPPSNSLDFAQKRHLSWAARSILKDLAPALAEHLRKVRKFDADKQRAVIAAYLERLAGEAPLKGTYRKASENLTKGRPLTRGMKNPVQVRRKLERKSGVTAAKEAAAKLPSSIATSERMSLAYRRRFGMLDAGLGVVIEVVNLACTLGELKGENQERPLLTSARILGSAAGLSMVLSEITENLVKQSAKQAAKRTTAVLGIVAGACDFIDFSVDAARSAEQYDYGQAVGHTISAAGAATSLVGTAMVLKAAAAGAATGVGLIVVVVGVALAAGGSVLAQWLAANPYEQFAIRSFLGRKRTRRSDVLSWTSIELPNPNPIEEATALVQLLSNFQVSLKAPRGVIRPGYLQDGSVFEVYIEQHFLNHTPTAAKIEVDPMTGDVRQVAGNRLLLPDNLVRFDKDEQPEAIEISFAMEKRPPVLQHEKRVMRVRLRLPSNDWVPPQPPTKPPQWVEVDDSLASLGTRSEAASADTTRRTDLATAPFLPMSEVSGDN